jgi:hypothetical protein
MIPELWVARPRPGWDDVGFTKKGGASGFGNVVREGQLVPITHPFVRANPSNFVTIARPLTPEDLPDE